MSDADFIDDRGEAGPEDNAEWLRWAAETYASAVAKGGCYAPEPEWDVDAISPGLRGAAAEIERLRARVEVLAQHLRDAVSVADMAMSDANGCYCRRTEMKWDRWYREPELEVFRAALKEAKP
jgi:hypothetical protein